MQSGDRKVGIVLQSLWDQGLLNLPRNAQFLLQTLSFLFVLDQPGVIKNASSLRAKGIEDLPIERRKSGRAF